MITNASNPKYITSDNSVIMLDVEIEGTDGTHQFVARADDVEDSGKEIYKKATAGEYGPIATYVPPEPIIPPIVIPSTISDRQFFQQLAIQNIITKDDALNAVKTGFIPTALQSIIDPMPEDEKFAAEMLLSGATIFQRNHPLTNAIGQTYGMTSEQIDEFFINANKL